MENHHVLLYVSTLAPDAPVSEVANIARHARVRNVEKGITGILAFDGMGFVQLLEGREADLRALFERLRSDRRHVELELLCFRPATQAPRLRTWSMGYHFIDSERDTLERFRGLRGDEAMQAFERMAAGLDAEAGVALPD